MSISSCVRHHRQCRPSCVRARGEDANLERLDGIEVDADRDVADGLGEDLFNVLGDAAECRGLDARLHNARHTLVVDAVERRRHQRRLDILGGVDDLLDPRHPQRDVHACDAGEVEGLQRHLCARFTDTLCANGADRRARLDARLQVHVDAAQVELVQLRTRDPQQLPTGVR